MSQRLTWSAVLVGSSLAACAGNDGSPASACATGAESCACYPNSTCNGALSCRSNLCVNLGGTDGAGGVGGTVGLSGAGGTAGSSGVGGTAGSNGAGGTGGAVACLPINIACGAGVVGLCCAGTTCVSGKCAATCALNGQCASNCCAPLASGSGSACAPASVCAATTCLPVSSTCGVGVVGACCTGTTCVIEADSTTCVPKCTLNGECASNCCVGLPSGSGSVCLPASHCACLPADSACAVGGTVCCAGTTCVSGTCAAPCTLDSQCASNCCFALASGSGKACAPASVCGTIPVNSACTYDYECANRGMCWEIWPGGGSKICNTGVLQCFDRQVSSECSTTVMFFCEYVRRCGANTSASIPVRYQTDFNYCTSTECSSISLTMTDALCSNYSINMLKGTATCP